MSRLFAGLLFVISFNLQTGDELDWQSQDISTLPNLFEFADENFVEQYYDIERGEDEDLDFYRLKTNTYDLIININFLIHHL